MHAYNYEGALIINYRYSYFYIATDMSCYLFLFLYTSVLFNNAVGAFAAGWPFAHAIENYSWSVAYSLLELVSLVMLGLCSYLLLLLLRGLIQARRKVE